MNTATSAAEQQVCMVCGWVYDAAQGSPAQGIAPGTPWADLPADWRCPDCNVGAGNFAPVE